MSSIASPTRRSASSRGVDVSALVVNYNSGAFAVDLVRTLWAQEFEGTGGDAGKLEIIVLDNCSPRDQSPFLTPLAERGVRVIHHPENRGYAAGANAALRAASGEFLLFLNPDVLVASGAVESLVRRLRDRPRTGLVGPRGWLDPARFWLLPPLTTPTLGSFLAESLGCLRRPWARRVARRRSRASDGFWTAQRPFPWPATPGYGFMMPAALARELGPFDENYPLYYEDCDLGRRLWRAGYEVEIVPGAEMIHLYNRSAGQDMSSALEKHDVARRYYYEKFYGRFAARLHDRVSRYVRREMAKPSWHAHTGMENLGPVADPPRLRLRGAPDRWLAEIAADPCFFWKAGHYGSGETFEIPEVTWNCLEAATLYLRFLDPDTLSTLATYSFVKTTPSNLPLAEPQASQASSPAACADA